MAEDATHNLMKQKLAAGELVLCMNLRLARSVDIAMVAKAGGYDALYVDMQHAPYSIDTTATICAASLGVGITPLVRVPSHDGQWMSRVLDGGAQGVIVPDVESRAQAEAVGAPLPLSALGPAFGDGAGAGARLSCGAARRVEHAAQRRHRADRHAGNRRRASTMPRQSPRCRGSTYC